MFRPHSQENSVVLSHSYQLGRDAVQFSAQNFVGQIKIERVYFKQSTPRYYTNTSVPRTLRLHGGLPYTLYDINLVIKVSFDGLKISNHKGHSLERNLQTPLRVAMDSLYRIRLCYAPNSKAALCEDVGGVWNLKSHNLEQRCEPDVKCFVQQSFSSSSCPRPYKKIVMGKHLSGKEYKTCVWCSSLRKQ